MSGLEDSNGHVRRDEAHERWLAMQSAYAEYMRVSEVFENSRDLARDSVDPGSRDVALLDCRRDAFERYLETRMEYLERRYDEGCRREAAMASLPSGETVGLRTVSQLARPKWPVIPVLVAGILGVTVFSLVREQKRVRDLDSARDQIRAALSNNREQIQLLVKRLDAWESAERSAIRQVEHPAQPPAPAPQVDGLERYGRPQRRRAPERMMKTTSRSVVARGYFSLSHSQLKRVGPIKMSLKSVNVHRNSVDVSIVSESGKVNVQRIRLNQPLRIKGPYRGQTTELVVDRITRDGLSGHLIEFRG